MMAHKISQPTGAEQSVIKLAEVDGLYAVGAVPARPISRAPGRLIAASRRLTLRVA